MVIDERDVDHALRHLDMIHGFDQPRVIFCLKCQNQLAGFAGPVAFNPGQMGELGLDCWNFIRLCLNENTSDMMVFAGDAAF